MQVYQYPYKYPYKKIERVLSRFIHIGAWREVTSCHKKTSTQLLAPPVSNAESIRYATGKRLKSNTTLEKFKRKFFRGFHCERYDGVREYFRRIDILAFQLAFHSVKTFSKIIGDLFSI